MAKLSLGEKKDKKKHTHFSPPDKSKQLQPQYLDVADGRRDGG